MKAVHNLNFGSVQAPKNPAVHSAVLRFSHELFVPPQEALMP